MFRVIGTVRRVRTSDCAALELREDLHQLTHGFAPDGRKLVQNAGRFAGDRKRHLGISYVISAPKSWSVLWAFADPSLRRKMEAALERALRCTIHEYIEPEVARCRLGDGTEVAAKLAAAALIHWTSREHDMQVHAHLLFPNFGLCPDGRTRALVSKRFYERKLDAGACFRVSLEHECSSLACNSIGR